MPLSNTGDVDVPLFHGVELSVTKSTTSCSISNTVILFPFITVRLGTVVMRGSEGVPPLNMMYGSLTCISIHNTHRYTHVHVAYL